MDTRSTCDRVRPLGRRIVGARVCVRAPFVRVAGSVEGCLARSLRDGAIPLEPISDRPPPPRGAVHSAEIEYAMGNLATNKVYAWKPEDYKVSEIMQQYFAKFVKSSDPNGTGLPTWLPVTPGADAQVMHIDVETRLEPEKHRGRYLLLDQIRKK